MAKTYYGQANNGGHAAASGAPVTSPPASGAVTVLVHMGPTRGNEWQYSGAVNGTTTFFVVDNGPTLGRQRSAS